MIADWHSHLISTGANIDAEQVRDFGAPDRELRACAEGTVVCDLSHFGLMQFSGEDAQSFLQGQLTNDVKRVSGSVGQYTAYCTPKGRMLASMLLFMDHDGYKLQLPQALLPGVLKRLSMYILRAKVKAADASEDSVRLGLAGSRAAEALAELGEIPSATLDAVHADGIDIIRLGEQRFELFAAPDRAVRIWEALRRTATPVGAACWQWLEIRAGVPIVLPETQEAFVPQMVNLERIGGVSFKKGCYPGQEIVARTHYLGKLKRRMYLAHVDSEQAPAPATPIFSPDLEGQASGDVVVSAAAPQGGYDLLAVMQISSREQGEAHLGHPDGPLLEWLPLPYPLDD